MRGAGGDRVNDFRNNDHTAVWADADWWDNFIETARTRGVYLLYLCNDWTRWKSTDTTVAAGGCAANSTTIPVDDAGGFEDSGSVRINGLNTVEYDSKDSTYLYGCSVHPAYSGGEQVNQTENPYIAEGVAPNLDETFYPSNTTMREVYKRKLRWLMARWGYSTSLVGFDLINECQRPYSSTRDFHNDMAAFVNGESQYWRDVDTDGVFDPGEKFDVVPASWPIQDNFQEEQPHHLSGDMKSEEYRSNKEVDWDNDSIGMCHFHGYARPTDGSGDPFYGHISWDLSNEIDWLGSQLTYMWQDAAEWADRLARVHRRSGFEKPFSWTEYGLIKINLSNSHWGDWTAAYQGDTAGQHLKDWIWGLAFNGVSGCHWHPEYLRGDYSDPPFSYTHWERFAALSNYLIGMDFRGMTQETFYHVSDSENPTKHLEARDPNEALDENVRVMGFRSSDYSYLYAKNTTNTWYYTAGRPESLSCPTPSQQTTDILVKGLQPSTEYTIERWSTTDTNPATQIKGTIYRTTDASGTLRFPANWDSNGNRIPIAGTGDYDWAYKIYE